VPGQRTGGSGVEKMLKEWEATPREEALMLAGAVGSVRVQPPAVTTAIEKASAIAVGALAAVVIGLELVKPVHVVDPSARAAIGTAIALSALLSAFLLGSHFNRTRRVSDLLLLAALATVPLTDFAFAALPPLGGVHAAGPGNGGWLGCLLVIAIAGAAVGLAPDRKILCERRRAMALAAIAGIGTVVLAELFDVVSGSSRVYGALHHPVFAATTHDSVTQAVAVISSSVLLLVGIALVHRVGRADPDAWLMAAVCFLLAADGLVHVAVPASAADWVTPGDGFRLAAYGGLLAVALRRYSRMRHQAARAALDEERQRIARDLHDGLAQDLAFIGVQAQTLDSQLGTEHPLMLAARSALAVSRGMIVDLAARSAPTTEAALRLVADEMGARFGAQVRVRVVAATDASGHQEPGPAEREQLVRIAREAIANAVRHGGAQRVDVVLDCRGTHRLLLVSDDGSGITETALQSRNGFGLPIMRARAESLGGRLLARRGIDGGTQIEVLLGAAPVGSDRC
jgi:signal transduction histidine kinase